MTQKLSRESLSLRDQDIANSRKAALELADYLRKNKLDPRKDWRKDPKHGATITEYMRVIALGERKLQEKNMEKKQLKKPSIDILRPKKKIINNHPIKYDYPMVEGKEMSPEFKKLYREKMRRLLKSRMEVSKASKIAIDYILSKKG